MKTTSTLSRFVLFAALGVFVAGCKPAPDTTEAQSANAIDKQLADVKTSAADTADALSAYTYAQKKEFIATMEAQLVEMEDSLDELSDRISQSSLAIRAEAEPKLAALRVRKESLEKQLEVVRDAESSTWDVVKTSTGEAYNDLKSGFNDMRQWLSNKMAP